MSERHAIVTHPSLGHSARVVCGIDASRADAHATAQACDLAGAAGSVELVCVVHATGAGATAQASIAPARARVALDRARSQVIERGVRGTTQLVHEAAPAAALVARAATHDALVVGSHATSRAGGILLGGAATYALHQASVPVLVARELSTGALRDSIVVASNGSPHSDAASARAVALADEGTHVTLATVGGVADAEASRRLARQAVDLFERTGREPTMIAREGHPADVLVDLAREVGATLLVLGSGGKTGVRALGSVSERVAHRAACSVLVARG